MSKRTPSDLVGRARDAADEHADLYALLWEINDEWRELKREMMGKAKAASDMSNKAKLIQMAERATLTQVRSVYYLAKLRGALKLQAIMQPYVS